MREIDDETIQLVVTSPPYNSSVRKDNHKYPGGNYEDDLSEDEYTDLFKAVHRVSERLKSSFNSTKVSIVVDGYSINHVHVHLIPTNKEGDLGDFPRYTLADGELAKTGQELNDFKEV